METELKTRWVSLSDQLAGTLRRSAEELEKFSLQVKLGSMELRDLFEKIKQEMKKFLVSFSSQIRNIEILTYEEKKKLQYAIDELNLQLSLGRSDARDFVLVQYKKLYTYLSGLKRLLNNLKLPKSIKNSIDVELRKFQIKMTILKLKFESRRLQFSKKYARNNFFPTQKY